MTNTKLIALVLAVLLGSCVDRQALIDAGLTEVSTQTVKGEEFEVFHNSREARVFYVPEGGVEISHVSSTQGVDRFVNARAALQAASGCSVEEFVAVPETGSWQGLLNCPQNWLLAPR